jgi:hypothetical protein
MARDYDPEKWDEEINRVMMQYWAQRIPPDQFAAMTTEMADVGARWLQAAKAAFPTAEVWFEDTSSTPEFVAEIEARMSEEDARAIRSLRSDVPQHTWRAIAEWAYENRSQTWRIGWKMPGHQEVGEAICEAAANTLGEDPHSSPWN